LSGSADGRPCPSTALFSLIAARYERGSILLTSNKGFGEWVRSWTTLLIRTARGWVNSQSAKVGQKYAGVDNTGMRLG